jgi:hypothetical protein
VFSLNSHIDIGLRHILPVFPFLFIAIAVAAKRAQWMARAAMILVPLLVLETAGAYSNYLAFFNLAVGGPGAGPRYLADSNIDWGQDLENLKKYMDHSAIPEVCLSYFGSADPAYYKLAHRDLRAFPPPAGCSVAAVSVDELLSADSSLKPFLACRPRARIGYSIYVYDVQSCVAELARWHRLQPVSFAKSIYFHAWIDVSFSTPYLLPPPRSSSMTASTAVSA